MKNKDYMRILKMIAEKEGVGVIEVEKEIQKAIDIGFDKSDCNNTK